MSRRFFFKSKKLPDCKIEHKKNYLTKKNE